MDRSSECISRRISEATSADGRLDRARITVVVLYACRIGSNTAGVSASVSDWYLPVSTTPTTSIGGPWDPYLKCRPKHITPAEDLVGKRVVHHNNATTR
jgi:hypothetical protein